MAASFTIVGLGEALFDIFPDQQILGGAPLNVAVHAHQLGQVRGGQGVVVSRIGQDDLGRRVVDDLTARGMSTAHLQTDPDRPTGRVYVGTDARGQPEYEIVEGVAWDWLQADPDLEDLARSCDAVCFGSLAQRIAQSRRTIYRFLNVARQAIRMFDVNLRQNSHSRDIIRESIKRSTVVKLNVEELPIVASLTGLPKPDGPAGADAAAEALLRRHKLKAVVLTRGEQGTALYTPAGKAEGAPVQYESAENADHVGAGDACAAAILLGMVLRLAPQPTVDLANHAGAFVASQPGATPALPESILDMIRLPAAS